MAQSISLGATPLSGQGVWIIDTIAASSRGVLLVLGVSTTWRALSGSIFAIASALDMGDGIFRPWHEQTAPGGALKTHDGKATVDWYFGGTWPGVDSGNGKFASRRVLIPARVRMTIDVIQPFTPDRLLLGTI